MKFTLCRGTCDRERSYIALVVILLGSGLTACSDDPVDAGSEETQSAQPAVVAPEAERIPVDSPTIRYSKAEGAGVPGSPEMVRLTEEWKSLNQSEGKERGRQLFNQNKYGMFIHWGLYSTLGGVWQGKRMEDGGHGPLIAEWIMRRKEIPRAEYAKLAASFNPTEFDAKEWVAIAKAAGMRYMVITSKHHDGFAMYDSKVSDYDIVDATPFGRDIIRELEQACKEAGISFGVYYSQSIDWMDGGDAGYADHQPDDAPQWTHHMTNKWDPSPVSFEDYIYNKSLPQVRELVTNYDLTQIWFDTPIFTPPEYSMAFYRTLYEANPEILASQRIGNGFGDIGTPRDNEIPGGILNTTWEGIATTNNSWGYKSYDTDWKSPLETLYWLVENVSKGGNFLLNVGPDGSGRIPSESVENLLAVGRWLDVYGEAIYGTRPWKVSHEGPTKLAMGGTQERAESGFSGDFKEDDFWFTYKDNRVFVIALSRPESPQISIQSLKDQPIRRIRMLGGDNELEWQEGESAIDVDLPEFHEDGIGYVLEITLAGRPN